VTAENRVWICRTLFTLFKKLLLFNRKKLFCYNLITSEQQLRITERNTYTAVEIVTVRPIFNENLYREFMKANSWTAEYLPNSQSAHQRSGCAESPIFPVEKMLNVLLPPEKLDALDRWLLEKWKTIWRKRYHQLSLEELGNRFQCQRNVSTAYAGDFLPKVMGQYRHKLNRYGIVGADQSLS
jgi:hypothetical protein